MQANITEVVITISTHTHDIKSYIKNANQLEVIITTNVINYFTPYNQISFIN